MFQTISEVRSANRAIGHHFFSRDTMKFFGSRVVSGLYAGRYFITSEKAGFTSEQRRFTIREALPSGEVKTVSEFNKFHFVEDARKACRKLVAKDKYPWSVAGKRDQS